jgi:tetratricopeptide (TPR) repeat protein
MNRTALIPLSLFLLVIVVATVGISHYEKELAEYDVIIGNDTLTEGENFYSLNNYEGFVKNYQPPTRENIDIFQYNAQVKPSLYISLIKIKDLIVGGNMDKAESSIRTLIVFYPENVEALSLLAGIYSFTGKYDLADDLLKKILKLDPANSMAHENLGFVLEKQKKYRQALSSLLKASLINPDSPIAYIHIAKINSILGNKEKAMDNFAKAYELMGNSIYPFSFLPAFDNIRSMPLFVEIVEKIGNQIQ